MRNLLLALAAVCSMQSVIDAEMRGNCNQFCLRHENGYKKGIYFPKNKICFCGDPYDMDVVTAPTFGKIRGSKEVIHAEGSSDE